MRELGAENCLNCDTSPVPSKGGGKLKDWQDFF